MKEGKGYRSEVTVNDPGLDIPHDAEYIASVGGLLSKVLKI